MSPIKSTVLLGLMLAAVVPAQNVLENGSFGERSDGNLPGWTTRAWGRGKAEWLSEVAGRNDGQGVSIRSETGADAAWTSVVPVSKHSNYKLSGWIRTQDLRGAKGALFNIQGLNPAQTRAISGTQNWTAVSVVFNSGDRSELEVNCLFGGWGQSSGQAWYDDVVLRPIDVRVPGTLNGREALQAVPIMTRDGMPFPILGVGVDLDGTVYVTETIRQMREEISLIQSPGLQQVCMSFTTTADKRQWIEENFSRHIAGRQGVTDFNKDGAIDAADLTVRSEKIYTLHDSDKDGRFDQARLFADGFRDSITGVAHSVAPIDGHVYATIVPDVWRLRDSDGDGVADERERIAHGFAPHIGYGNHDLHSVIQGYDGKLYWSMGDRGINVTTKAGRRVSNPHSGCILRSNPDGSELELFAYGLRNCQYVDFDDYGNLFSVDHDADFQGERERLVYLAEGSDAGWRMYYQYRSKSLVKAARDELYNPWLAEKMWIPDHEGQPSHILPPIENSWNAPAAFSYQPGTALGGKYAGHFLLGGQGDIRAFRMEPAGASFKRVGDDVLIGGLSQQVLTSTFGPDGRLYFTLWKPRGTRSQLWALQGVETPASTHVEALLAGGLQAKALSELKDLLGHADRRIRQQAQFELVRRANAELLTAVLRDSQASLLPRLHSLWALGQLKHKDADLLDQLCTDADPEIRAQAARWAGDLGFDPNQRLPILLADSSPRVRMLAAIACGKLGSPEALAPLCEMLVTADNREPTLRHAGVVGLAGVAQPSQLAEFATHPSEALRIAAVLALRRLHAADALTVFLQDKSPQVVADAVRGIYDEASPGSLQGLDAVAALLAPGRSLAINVRAIAANRRLGSIDAARRIVAFLATAKLPLARVEGLYALESWPESPSPDPVDGRHFPVSAGDPDALRTVIGSEIWALTEATDATLAERAIALLKRIDPTDDELAAVVARIGDAQRPEAVRVQWLKWLRGQDMTRFGASAIQLLTDENPELRLAAARELRSAKRGQAELQTYLRRTLTNSKSVSELQQAIRMVDGLPDRVGILGQLLDDLIAGRVAPEVQLDVMESVAAAGSHPELAEKLDSYRASLAQAPPLTRFASSLHGGSADAGRRLFHTHAQAQCSKCHALKMSDKQVGPSLEGVGARQSRAYLLQSIIAPQAVIVPGYGVITLALKDGSSISGMLMAESEDAITVKLPNGDTQTISRSRIDASTAPIGTMPDLSSVLTPRQIRDLVAFLASL
jgi:quinoprotein glucose dehydrogenase